MTQINAIEPVINERKPVYNALKIQVNSPQTNIPEGVKNEGDNGEYNAVSIEVNDPAVNMEKQKQIYSYPEAVDIITYDKAGILPVDMPNYSLKPLTYQTNLINNKTFINAEFEVRNKKNGKPVGKIETFETNETVQIPESNYTTVEAEKNPEENGKIETITFNGKSFKANRQVEVVPDANIQSAVNIEDVVNKLKSSNYDEQALQLEEIALKTIDNPKEAIPYLTTRVFSEIENIIRTDSAELETPTEEQTEIRKKIILNEIAKVQAKKENPNIKNEEIKIPYEISKSDMELAIKLSPFEMAERNKEYGIYTLAGLLSLYISEFEKNMNDVVPFTDLPAISSIVDTIKNTENPDLKLDCVNALLMLKNPEYNEEIKAILNIVAKDKNEMVAEYSAKAIDVLEKNN